MNDRFDNLNQALLAAVDDYAERTCFHVSRGKRFQAITYERFRRYTFRLTHFFLENGIGNGERIAIIADNPLEWMVVYVAGLLAGGVVVPLRAWLPLERLQAMLKESGAHLAVIQGEPTLPIIEQMGKALPKLKTVLVVSDPGDDHAEAISITSILAKPITEEAELAIRQSAAAVDPTALALIYYKSATPRGAVFDHARRLAAMRSMAEWFHLSENDVAVTTILSWNLATLDVTLHYFLSGVAHVVTGSQEETDVAQQLSPTVILTTPSGVEDFYNQTIAEINRLPAPRQAIFQWALKIGREYLDAGLAVSKELSEAYARADITFFSQIRGRLGGRLRRIYSTGAQLPHQWAEFAEIIGITPLNVYSLTEAGGFPTISSPDARRPNSCGQVAPGFQVRVADDGEILVRGPSVMCGYWRRPDDTTAVIDAGGWLHTGDLGRFDQDGFLYLIGHKQPLFSLSTGRNIMPTTIESDLTASPFIDQAVVFGEGRPYIAALVVPDLPVIEAHLRQNGYNGDQTEFTVGDDQVRTTIGQVVADVNKTLDTWSHIQEFRLLPQPFNEAKGELKPSKKICRDVVADHYAAEIEAMYPNSTPFSEKAVTYVKLEPSELHDLLEKQDILDAWLADAGIEFLFDLAQRKQIDAASIVHICDTAASIAQMVNEERPLSTALIVGDPPRIARHLPVSQIQMLQMEHIRRMRKNLTTLAMMVDGKVLGYVIDKHGYVRGIHKLDDKLDNQANPLLGPQFRRHAAISGLCDALVFYVPSGGKQVRVFADGQLVGRYSNGDWSQDIMPQVDEVINQLAQQKNLKFALLQRLLRCAFQMSEENLGAIFIVGNADAVIEKSDAPEISHFAWIFGTDVRSLSDEELINFAKQDGATVIDVQGKFRGCMVLLRPDSGTKAEIGPGRGARHSSAAKMSAETDCLAITVSQDGPITVYDSGRRVLSL